MPRILVADRDPRVQEAFEFLLEAQGHTIIKVRQSGDVLRQVAAQDPVLAVLEIEDQGFPLLEQLKQAHPELAVLLTTSMPFKKQVVQALRAGAADYLPKPLKATEMTAAVKRCLSVYDEREKIRATRAPFAADADEVDDLPLSAPTGSILPLIGDSADAMDLQDAVGELRETDYRGPVLLHGPRGSQIRELARHLHRQRPDPKGPLYELEAGALTDLQLYRELIGDGAGGRFFAREDDATLFIHDLSRLPPSLQWLLAKALPLLPPGQLILLGLRETADEALNSEHLMPELHEAIRERTLSVAPLAERTEDIPEMVEHLLEQTPDLASEVRHRKFPMSSLSMLQNYRWEGNLNELERVVILAATAATGTEVTADLVAQQLA